jgi:RimJ/RimL family protein N-acetyltransferase
MRPGTFFRKFHDREGREVTLRAPQWSDLDEMLDFINSLVEENVDILVDTKYTREAEVGWLAARLSELENDRIIMVAAEVNGRFVGQTAVSPKIGRSSHVGVLGISLKDGYRDAGIGTELIREAENQTHRLGIEIITLDVFASNAMGRHLYAKMGYIQVGQVPRGIKRDGEYIDDVIMAKELPK